jgi:hypothetical protein
VEDKDIRSRYPSAPGSSPGCMDSSDSLRKPKAPRAGGIRWSPVRYRLTFSPNYERASANHSIASVPLVYEELRAIAHVSSWPEVGSAPCKRRWARPAAFPPGNRDCGSAAASQHRAALRFRDRGVRTAGPPPARAGASTSGARTGEPESSGGVRAAGSTDRSRQCDYGLIRPGSRGRTCEQLQGCGPSHGDDRYGDSHDGGILLNLPQPDPLEWLRDARAAPVPADPPTADCLDDDTIGALAEGTLDFAARSAVLPHLASCAQCRATVASVTEGADRYRVTVFSAQRIHSLYQPGVGLPR